MKKILVATRNNDKFRIVSYLLKSSIFENYDFYNLRDLNEEIIDKEETGNVIERSYTKAENVFSNIEKNDFDYIVGIDDGIKMKGSLIENVKDYIKRIIDDEFLEENEIVYITRSYTFFNKNGKNISILTEIPFKYKKITNKIDIQENSYPLSNVLCPIDSEYPVAMCNDDNSNQYYLKYSDQKFKEVKDFYDNK